jgi:hypothetical protein
MSTSRSRSRSDIDAAADGEEAGFAVEFPLEDPALLAGGLVLGAAPIFEGDKPAVLPELGDHRPVPRAEQFVGGHGGSAVVGLAGHADTKELSAFSVRRSAV